MYNEEELRQILEETIVETEDETLLVSNLLEKRPLIRNLFETVWKLDKKVSSDD